MSYPNLLDRWAGRVQQHGDQPALVTPDRVLTHRNLAELAGGLRAELIDRAGSDPDGVVSIVCADRALVTATILAAAGLGRRFAPIDLSQPAARLAALVDQLQPAAVVADAAGRAALAAAGRDDGTIDADAVAPGPWPWTAEAPADRGYVYFTSGTTGRPKGIVGSLEAVAHFVDWEIAEFAVDAQDRVSMLTSPGFDAYLRDALVPLCAGGSAISAESVPVGAALAAWLREHRITVLHCVPTVWRTLRAVELGPGSLPDLRAVLLAGEAVRPADVAWWCRGPGDGVPLVNLYGPSETTMTKVFRRLSKADADADVVPVGRPMPGVTVRLMASGRPTTDRVGEVEIATPFRLGGYLDGYTGGFVDPHHYRTGDLGRLRPDGELEILGRRDQQVKVNGVRVELGEVEDVLRRCPGVTDACVALVDDDDGDADPVLCAYLVADGVTDEVLREHVAAVLPIACRPAVYLRLAVLPRTLSGKIDRRRLPSPAAVRATEDTVAPRPGAETVLAEIYGELLGLPRVGRDDDFGLLGGDSLRTARLLDRVRIRFGVEVSLRAFMADPTVAGLATTVEAATIGATTTAAKR
ncbi:non-ribosomal peptide synthetase [Plantactinospora soyae]|uniref:Amino acid adenylation domain-containing protein n=1 Tax=Plantactinospora soyae TaxID=1544732 RepID=A0A927QWH2_9ACTN|nr:non-ribosomal peptide synthetase [Plantactinospora soyae]MBE1485552.1 amino acid adenylation domain-containing protein [Plantactinospora soyae]